MLVFVVNLSREASRGMIGGGEGRGSADGVEEEGGGGRASGGGEEVGGGVRSVDGREPGDSSSPYMYTSYVAEAAAAAAVGKPKEELLLAAAMHIAELGLTFFTFV